MLSIYILIVVHTEGNEPYQLDIKTWLIRYKYFHDGYCSRVDDSFCLRLVFEACRV